jgi:hypothetical protein
LEVIPDDALDENSSGAVRRFDGYAAKLKKNWRATCDPFGKTTIDAASMAVNKQSFSGQY